MGLMQIFVRTQNEKTITISDVLETDTILMIKLKVQQRELVPPDE